MATAPLEIPTYEAAQAEVDRLAAQQTEWIEKRAALVQDLEAQRTSAGWEDICWYESGFV